MPVVLITTFAGLSVSLALIEK